MCKVYEFPMKNDALRILEERLDKTVREFVTITNESLYALYGDNPTEEECNSFMELMVMIYMEALEKAIDELV